MIPDWLGWTIFGMTLVTAIGMIAYQIYWLIPGNMDKWVKQQKKSKYEDTMDEESIYEIGLPFLIIILSGLLIICVKKPDWIFKFFENITAYGDDIAIFGAIMTILSGATMLILNIVSMKKKTEKSKKKAKQ